MKSPEQERGGVEIAKATIDDLRGISDVQREGWLSTYPNEQYGITTEDILTEDFHSVDRIERRREIVGNPESGTKFFVAKDGEVVIGYCCVQKEKDFNKLRALYVLPAFQKQGIGRQLLERAFAFLDMTKPTKLNVAVYNDNAIAFYEKMGFVRGRLFEKNPDGAFPSGREIPEMEMEMGPMDTSQKEGVTKNATF